MAGRLAAPASRRRSGPTRVLVLVPLLVLGGTVGYRLLEGWPWLDCLYMTVITLSTVGFGEVGPFGPAGRLFTIGLILVGVGTAAYGFARLAETLLDRTLLQRRRTMRAIARLHGHVVVCGYGRMGATLATQLAERGVPQVVVERDPARLRAVEEAGVLFVPGDATQDEILLAAGVDRARALAAVLPDDAQNLFVTLTARGLRPDLVIVARSADPRNDPKLASAGATRVFNPYHNGGRFLARQLLHPTVTEFLDVLQGPDPELEMEEVHLATASPLAGRALRDVPIRRELDVIVLGIRDVERRLAFNPPPERVLAAGEVLVVLGHRDSLERLARLAEGTA